MPDQKPRERVTVTKGRAHKKRKSFLLQLSPGVVFKLRRIDLMGLLFEGALPAPIFAAIGRFQDLRKGVVDQQSTIADVLGGISEDDRAAFMDLMRRVAVVVTIEPKLTHSKFSAANDDDLLWVGGISDMAGDSKTDQPGDLTVGELLTIWRGVCGEAGVVILDDNDALEFRPDESQSDDSVASDGRGVRTEAVVMDSHAGDLATTPGGGRARIIHH